MDDICTRYRYPAQVGCDHGASQEQEEWRHDAQRAAHVERGQVVGTATCALFQQQGRNQEAGNDEEYDHAKVRRPAGNLGVYIDNRARAAEHVPENHQQDRNRAQSVKRSNSRTPFVVRQCSSRGLSVHPPITLAVRYSNARHCITHWRNDATSDRRLLAVVGVKLLLRP